jgi:hypothetical protein
VGENDMLIVELYPKHRIGQQLGHRSREFDQILAILSPLLASARVLASAEGARCGRGSYSLAPAPTNPSKGPIRGRKWPGGASPLVMSAPALRDHPASVFLSSWSAPCLRRGKLHRRP